MEMESVVKKLKPGSGDGTRRLGDRRGDGERREDRPGRHGDGTQVRQWGWRARGRQGDGATHTHNLTVSFTCLILAV